MLVLTRRIGQAIRIGPDIEVHVVHGGSAYKRRVCEPAHRRMPSNANVVAR